MFFSVLENCLLYNFTGMFEKNPQVSTQSLYSEIQSQLMFIVCLVSLVLDYYKLSVAIYTTKSLIRITFSVLCQGTYNEYIFTILTYMYRTFLHVKKIESLIKNITKRFLCVKSLIFK